MASWGKRMAASAMLAAPLALGVSGMASASTSADESTTASTSSTSASVTSHHSGGHHGGGDCWNPCDSCGGGSHHGGGSGSHDNYSGGNFGVIF